MREVVIASAARTPIGSLGGALAGVSAVALGTVAVQAAVQRAGIDADQIDELILGQVIQAGCGSNPARQVQISAGMNVSSTAYTVNKVCASGMKAVALGASAVAAGEADIVVAGGMENMSQAPYLLAKARSGYRLGNGELQDAILCDALTDPLGRYHMGTTAENLAKRYGIARDRQDELAAASQAKAGQAIAQGLFAREIAPVDIPQRRGEPLRVDSDEYPRPDTTAAKLAKLRPAFQDDGTVTAGNASGINDGAAALVLTSREEARRRGLHPLATIRSWASAGVQPEVMGLGPVPATKAALERAGLDLAQIDLVELNEAFAAQALAVIQELSLDEAKVNVHGGAIALGHPVGASGARILVTLLHALIQHDMNLGLATLCVGGGQGMAMILQRL